VKIDRAKKHLSELDAEVASIRGQRQTVVEKVEHDMGMHRFVDLDIGPFNVLATAGDVVQNLRSALDHLAYQLAKVGNPEIEPSHYLSFPVCRSAEIYEKTKDQKLAGVRKEAIAAIDALKPYKGGNEKLWALHNLNNTDKHRLILPVGRDHLWTGEGFDGGFWLKSDNPIFDELVGDSGTALLPTLHALVDFVDGLVSDFKPHLENAEEKEIATAKAAG
jgi:hypothetical protein